MKVKTIPTDNLAAADDIINTLKNLRLSPKRIAWLDVNSFSVEYDSIGKFVDARKMMRGSVIPDAVIKTESEVKSKRILYKF